MKRFAPCTALFQLVLFATWLPAQDADPSIMTLERLCSPDEFRSEGFGPARWLEDGSGYTTLERSKGEAGGRDIVKYDPATGERSVLIPAERLVPEGKKAPLGIADYAWSEDGRKMLIFTNTKRVWRRNTRGDYWVLDLETWKLEKLGGDADPSTLMFAKFSPDGTRVGYVRANNIYVERLADHTILPLTEDGSDTIINGTFDWVYEEEFSLRDGFRWSPDGERIAYWQLDAEGVGEFYLINNIDGLYSRVITVQYPKVGTTNSACRVGVVVDLLAPIHQAHHCEFRRNAGGGANGDRDDSVGRRFYVEIAGFGEEQVVGTGVLGDGARKDRVGIVRPDCAGRDHVPDCVRVARRRRGDCDDSRAARQRACDFDG